MCALDVIAAPSIFSVIRKAAALAITRATFALSCEKNAAAKVQVSTGNLRRLNS